MIVWTRHAQLHTLMVGGNEGIGILQVPLYYHNGVDHARDKSRVFMKRLIRATVALGPETVTENWFRRFSATAFRTRFLQPLQRYLSYVAVHQATNVS